MSTPLPRFDAVTRRHFLQRSLLAAGGLAAVGGLLAACGGSDDGDAFDDADGTPPTTAAASTTPSSIPGAGDTTVAAAPPLPAGAELQIDFTYAPASSGDRIRNPYIAVWVETPDGDLVSTVSLWFQAREAKYLRELTRWYSAESSFLDAGGADTVDMVSGATRTAGAYTVVWDGTDVDGNTVPQGDYVVCVEAAREHGPHSLSTVAVALGEAAVVTTMPDDGELSALTVGFVV